MIRQEQCDKVCRVLDDVLANRPTERDSLIIATRKAFEALEGAKWIPCSERKKGKWIEISSISHTYKCSECGRLLVNITDGKNNVARNYPYCHCGADMRGEQE